MIEIEEIQLDGLVMPSSRIGIVIAQPFIEIDGASEPHKWLEARKEHQLNVIRRTLEIAQACDHGCEKTHFTVFPEYSIPGLAGIALIDETIKKNEWKSGTLLTAGIDGLTEDEYETLCAGNNTFVQDCNRVSVKQDRWINCCITWVKESDRLIPRWVQLKLSPSWPERSIEHRSMMPGRGIFLFKAKFDKDEVECFFINLICFDWIGRMNSGLGIEAVLQSLNAHYHAGSPRKMHFIFLLQHNDKPNHRNFLGNMNWFFERRDHSALVDRADSIIVCVNSASSPNPRKYAGLYGFSSLISAPEAPYESNACPPTYAVKTAKLRGNELLGRSIDALFRENAACIHSVAVRIPQFVGRGPSDRCLPLDKASVYSTESSVRDPRLPGKPVPAIVKWINDNLDILPHLLNNQPNHHLKQQVEDTHKGLVEEIRWMGSKELEKFVLRCSGDSTCARNGSKWIKNQERPNIDYWDETERLALETILHALTVLKSWHDLIIKDAFAHGMIVIGDKVIDVLVVKDKSHEAAYKHFRDYFTASPQRHVILITRDERNTSVFPMNILDVGKCDLTGDPVITDVSARTLPLTFQSLCNCCDLAQGIEELHVNLRGQFRL